MNQLLRNEGEFCLTRQLKEGISLDPDLQSWKIKQLSLPIINPWQQSKPDLASVIQSRKTRKNRVNIAIFLFKRFDKGQKSLFRCG